MHFVASKTNRIIKVLEDCNIKLSTVVSDVKRASASKIINSIIDEADDITHLLTHIHGRIKTPREEITKALEERITPHHRFMLMMIRETIQEMKSSLPK